MLSPANLTDPLSATTFKRGADWSIHLRDIKDDDDDFLDLTTITIKSSGRERYTNVLPTVVFTPTLTDVTGTDFTNGIDFFVAAAVTINVDPTMKEMYWDVFFTYPSGLKDCWYQAVLKIEDSATRE